ncbi:restriction endonuclease subunit S [Eikenella corrodens]|uniref:restriction endonuclease subunit S n=1 Tax=Eikenella corrodens TaxID=539 RepID=UPI000669A3A3|nr:restriction endonuclease subunit S [Eikenella corrodens]
MNKQQEPRLRFQGFTGAWEEKVLGENASFTKGSGYSKSDLTNNGFPIILYGRLYTQYENIIENVDTFVSCDKNALKSLGNEVIVPASGETAEDIARASAVYQQDVILGGDLNIITPNENIASPFLALTLTNGKSNQELAKKAQGKSVVHLRNDDLRACKVSFPSFPEQTHLGLFFRRLDSQIAESRAVLEKSRQLKKAMLAKMFPTNGEKIPKIRFKGFEGEWESKKLGDVVEIVMGQSPSSTSYTDNPSDFILVQGNADMKNGKVCPRVWTTECIKLGAAGDIVMSVRAPVGDVGKTDYDIVVGRGVCAIKGNEFIYQTLWKMKLDGYWNSLSSGSTFEAINSNDVKNSEILIPIQEEQTAIGNFFRQLDETISLQSAEVEKLNQLKKGLLAAMLV